MYCRIRPLSQDEHKQGNAAVVSRVDPYSMKITTKAGPRLFDYTKVFGPEAGQETVFEDVAHLVQSTIDGFNVCIFGKHSELG